MLCKVKYVSYTVVNIPDEILATHDEEAIMIEVYNHYPDCLMVREVIGANNGKAYIEDY